MNFLFYKVDPCARSDFLTDRFANELLPRSITLFKNYLIDFL